MNNTDHFAGRSWKYWTEPSFVDVDGLQIAYRRKGIGNPLVFLHGAGLSRQWLPFYDELANHFDVIVPEHPGYGDSAASDRVASFEDLVLLYDGFLRELEIDLPHLVGHSMGAWLAADFAIFYPDRFRSLTLVSPLGVRTPGVSMPDPFRWNQEAANFHLINGYAENYTEYFEQEDEAEDFIREYGESIIFARLTWNPRYDVRLEWRLRRIIAPALIVHFADDRYVPIELSQRFADLIPNATLKAQAGTAAESASHLAFIQQPAAVAALIAEHATRH